MPTTFVRADRENKLDSYLPPWMGAASRAASRPRGWDAGNVEERWIGMPGDVGAVLRSLASW